MSHGSPRRRPPAAPAFSDQAATDRRRAMRQLLVTMARAERLLRASLGAAGPADEHPRLQALRAANAGRLETIIDAIGWPSAAKVGEDGAAAAWSIVQHAAGLPAFQRVCLHHLYQEAGRGGVPAWQPAWLLDCIRVREGRAQVYGTQLARGEDGRFRPLPIENPARVDQRRTGVGLPPLARVLAEHDRGATGDDRARIGKGIVRQVATRPGSEAGWLDDGSSGSWTSERFHDADRAR